MLILYTTEDGKSQIQLRSKDQPVWLTQREMAKLFDVSTDNIGLHLKNIFEDAELNCEATTEESSVVQSEGAREVQRPVTLSRCSPMRAPSAMRKWRAQPAPFMRTTTSAARPLRRRRPICRMKPRSKRWSRKSNTAHILD